jgi:hypothetical protein
LTVAKCLKLSLPEIFPIYIFYVYKLAPVIRAFDSIKAQRITMKQTVGNIRIRIERQLIRTIIKVYSIAKPQMQMTEKCIWLINPATNSFLFISAYKPSNGCG